MNIEILNNHLDEAVKDEKNRKAILLGSADYVEQEFTEKEMKVYDYYKNTFTPEQLGWAIRWMALSGEFPTVTETITKSRKRPKFDSTPIKEKFMEELITNPELQKNLVLKPSLMASQIRAIIKEEKKKFNEANPAVITENKKLMFWMNCVNLFTINSAYENITNWEEFLTRLMFILDKYRKHFGLPT